MKFVPLAVLSIALIAPVAAADAGTFECETLIGLSNPAFGASFPTAVGNIGGCTLVDTVTTSVVVALADGGCTIEADIDGDMFADGPVAVGDTLPGGSSVVAFCPLGTAGVVSSITLA